MVLPINKFINHPYWVAKPLKAKRLLEIMPFGFIRKLGMETQLPIKAIPANSLAQNGFAN
jgi:hypothetical protein